MKIINVSYTYPGGTEALSGISTEIAPGSLVCVAGANGSGKTTLLTLLAGLFAPSSGRIELKDAVSPGHESRLRKLTALVLQDADLQILGATVSEDLALGLDEDGRARAVDTARRLSMGELLDRPVQSLSWGQKRKLTLASALARNPAILLLDEPFSGLDYPSALEIRSMLAANKKNGITQVIAAHDLEPLADLADMVMILQAGQAVLNAPVTEIASRCAEYGVKPPGGAWPEAS